MLRQLIALIACLAVPLPAAGDVGFPGVVREANPGVVREANPGVVREANPGVVREANPGGSSPARLRLTFIGDIMAHSVNLAMGDFQDIYSGVADVFAADDLTFANLEFPFDPSQPSSGYPRFNAPREFVQAAIAAGIEVFSLANNHAFDQREEGIFQTLRSVAILRPGSPHLTVFSGIRGNPKKELIPQTVTVKGVRVGFVAVAQFLNDPQGTPFVYLVDYMDREAVAQFLDFVRRASPAYDLFIVSYHGDREYVQEPSPNKKKFFIRLLDSGAHIVYSHHPHVVQGFEVVHVKGADRLILYSLGNFISGMTARMMPSTPLAPRAITGDSFLLSVEVMGGGGASSVVDVTPIPVSNYRNARGEIVVGKLRDLAGGRVGVPADWVDYYKARLEVMDTFLSRFQ